MKKKAKKFISLNKSEQLIYDLVMGHKKNVTVNLSEYVDDLLQHDAFCQKVKSALIRSGFNIFDDDIKLNSTEMHWTFTMKVNNK